MSTMLVYHTRSNTIVFCETADNKTVSIFLYVYVETGKRSQQLVHYRKGNVAFARVWTTFFSFFSFFGTFCCIFHIFFYQEFDGVFFQFAEYYLCKDIYFLLYVSCSTLLKRGWGCLSTGKRKDCIISVSTCMHTCLLTYVRSAPQRFLQKFAKLVKLYIFRVLCPIILLSSLQFKHMIDHHDTTPIVLQTTGCASNACHQQSPHSRLSGRNQRRKNTFHLKIQLSHTLCIKQFHTMSCT